MKNRTVIRRKRAFRSTPAAMVCRAPGLTQEYIQQARLASQSRYAAQATAARKLTAARARLHTAQETDAGGCSGPDVEEVDPAREGPPRRKALSEAECIAVDLENLSEIASRSGKNSSTTLKANMEVLRAGYQRRMAGNSPVAAKLLAAADEAGGLPAPPPDADPEGGRGALFAEGDPLRRIQRCLSAQAATRSVSRAQVLASSPMQLRGPSIIDGGRLGANGIVDAMSAVAGGAGAAGMASVSSGSRYRGVVDFDGSGVFGLFQDDYRPKTDVVYLDLAKTVMVTERLSGMLKVGEGTSVDELVNLFQPAMTGADQWSFGQRKALEMFFRRCRAACS